MRKKAQKPDWQPKNKFRIRVIRVIRGDKNNLDNFGSAEENQI
jgi:hypothetical protein